MDASRATNTDTDTASPAPPLQSSNPGNKLQEGPCQADYARLDVVCFNPSYELGSRKNYGLSSLLNESSMFEPYY
jgi:hypothetical protein